MNKSNNVSDYFNNLSDTENEAKYRTILDSSTNSLIIIDSKTDQILDINIAAINMYGYSKNEFLSLKYLDLCANDQKPNTHHQINLFSQYHKKHDGTIFPVETSTQNLILKQQQLSVIAINHLDTAKIIEEALDKSEKKFKAVIDNVLGYIYNVEFDGYGNILSTYHSPQCKNITGYDVSDYQENSNLWINMVYKKDQPLVTEFTKHLSTHFGSQTLKHRIVHKNGKIRWVSNTCAVQVNYNGNIIRKSGFIIDITEQKAMEKQLKYNAYNDMLTGLPNKKLFTDSLSRAISKAKRDPKYCFAVLFLDLDKFKHVNDSFGHLVGDKLLLEVSRRLKLAIRDQDTVARFAGDEFAVLIDNANDIVTSIHVAARIQEALAESLLLEEQKIFVSASIGILIYSPNYDSPDQMLRDADTAMYRAKNSGRAKCEIFDQRMHDSVVKTLQMENDIRKAIENREFSLNYQPIINIQTEKIVSVEALIRWNHPQKGNIPPAEFIHVAEETGCIIPITEWLIKTSFAQLSKWHEAGYHIRLAINLSVINLAQYNLPEIVASALKTYQIPADFITLEITENTAIQKFDLAVSTLRKLSTIGTKIAIDDFGTGYASLIYLKKFPVNILKIDRSFIKDAPHNPEISAIIKATIVMAHALKIHVIAEGVDNEEQLNFLKNLACDDVQGFLFSQAVAAEAIISLIENYTLETII